MDFVIFIVSALSGKGKLPDGGCVGTKGKIMIKHARENELLPTRE